MRGGGGGGGGLNNFLSLQKGEAYKGFTVYSRN